MVMDATEGGPVRWWYLTDADAVKANAEADRNLKAAIESGRSRDWRSTPDNAQYRHNARCWIAIDGWLGITLSRSSVRVRSTRRIDGPCRTRSDDVQRDVIVFCRGPYATHPGGPRMPQEVHHPPGDRDLRWVEFVGWVAGGSIERVGIRQGAPQERVSDSEGGWVVPWQHVEPIGTLRARLGAPLVDWFDHPSWLAGAADG